jgi:hypothetical protein
LGCLCLRERLRRDLARAGFGPPFVTLAGALRRARVAARRRAGTAFFTADTTAGGLAARLTAARLAAASARFRAGAFRFPARAVRAATSWATAFAGLSAGARPARLDLFRFGVAPRFMRSRRARRGDDGRGPAPAPAGRRAGGRRRGGLDGRTGDELMTMQSPARAAPDAQAVTAMPAAAEAMTAAVVQPARAGAPRMQPRAGGGIAGYDCACLPPGGRLVAGARGHGGRDAGRGRG